MTPNQDRSRFEQLLSDELNKKTNYNKDLIEERNNAQQQQLSLGQTLRSEWADSQMDPLQREAIIAQRRSQLGGRVGTLSDLLGARGQYFSDILGRAMGAYDAEMADKMRQEELARQRRAASAQASQQQAYLDWLKSQAGNDGGGMGNQVIDRPAPIDPAELRFNAYKDMGYDDYTAELFATQGAPSDPGPSLLQKGINWYVNRPSSPFKLGEKISSLFNKKD